MTLIIICEHCKQRISPSTPVKAIDSEAWCEACYKQKEAESTNTVAESPPPNFYAFIVTALADAGWENSILPNEKYNAIATTCIRFNEWDIKSAIWWNKSLDFDVVRYVEIFSDGQWKLWKFINSTLTVDLDGSLTNWSAYVDWIILTHSPK